MEGTQGVETPVIRNDNYNNAEKYDNNATFVHCVQIQNNAKKHDNNVAFSKNAEKHNNNVASAHCVNNSEERKIANAHKGLKPLVVRVKNFDSLSRKIKNPCSVINNFKLKEDISLWNIKKNF